MRPGRFTEVEFRGSGVPGEDWPHVLARYQGCNGERTSGRGAVDVVIRADGKLQFVIWHVLPHTDDEPVYVAREFDPGSGEVRKIRESRSGPACNSATDVGMVAMTSDRMQS